MNKMVFQARAQQFEHGCLLLPATNKDRRLLDSFCTEIGPHIATVTVSYGSGSKSYDQVKTVFALCAIIFECNYDRVPSNSENERLYRELLEEYGPREPSLLNPDKTTPIPLSRMDKNDAALFINALINLIMENCDLTNRQQVDVKQIFEEFQTHNFGDRNPADYDESGNMLSVEEWRKRNHFSFASGLMTEDLQLHHILSRGAFPQFADCTWNFLMLTDEEHNRIFHDHGWEYFLDLYPHLAKRVKNAFDEGHQVYSFDLQKALEKLNLIDSPEEYPEGGIF